MVDTIIKIAQPPPSKTTPNPSASDASPVPPLSPSKLLDPNNETSTAIPESHRPPQEMMVQSVVQGGGQPILVIAPDTTQWIVDVPEHVKEGEWMVVQY